MKQGWLGPKKVIEASCLHCNGGIKEEVEKCIPDPKFHVCAAHGYLLGQEKASPKMIRKLCLQCMGGSRALVRECKTADCFRHPYRMGKNPLRKGIGQNAERMRIIRPKKRP